MSAVISTSRWNRTQLIGAKLYWLLDLTFAGQVIRLSTEDLDIPSDDGDLCYYGGLLHDVDLDAALNMFDVSAPVNHIVIKALFPVNVPELVSLGQDLGSMTGVLSQIVSGTAYEKRRIVFQGRVVDPEYETALDPVSFSLEDNAYDDTALIPAPEAVVSAVTWPSAASGAVGRTYPLVLGAPGPYTYPGGAGSVSGSPALWVSAGLLLIAGHPVYAATVRISTDTDAEDFPVATQVDGLGRACSVVDISGAGVIAVSDSEDYHVTWNSGGGLINVQRSSTMEGAGDVLEYFLQQSTIRYDVGRLSVIKPALNTYKIACHLAESVKPWEWLTANLLPLLPISIVTGTSGIYPILWRYNATVADAVAHINLAEDPGIDRISPVQYDNNKIVNSFKIKYGLRSRTGQMQTYQIRAGNRDSADTRQVQSIYCKVSSTRSWGTRKSEIESIILYDGVTVGKVLSWKERALCFGTRYIQYSLPVPEGGWLALGAVVLLTDPEVYLTSAVALLEDILWTGDKVQVTLRLIEDIARDFRSMG